MATVVLAVIATAAVAYVLRPILLPFVLAGLLSILFKPLVTRLRTWHVPMAICVVVVLAITSSALWGMYAIAEAGVSSAIEKGPAYQQRITELTVQANRAMRDLSVSMTGRSSSISWNTLFDLSTLTSAATSTLGSVVSFVGDSFLVLLFLVFMVSSGELFPRKLKSAFGHASWVNASQLYESVNRHVLQYLRVKTLFNILHGLVTWAILEAFGVDFAPLMGLLAFLCHYLPNIGSIITTALPILVTLVQTGSFGQVALVAGVLIVVQNIIGNVIEPKVMGRSLDLSPVLVLFALAFWGWMWGIVGMILSVPIMAVIKTVLELFEGTRPIAVLMGATVPRDETAP